MCLGVPGKVVKKISEMQVLVDFGGITRAVDALLVPDIKEGDLVIVHAGAIIGKIDEETFNEIISAYRELAEAMREDQA